MPKRGRRLQGEGIPYGADTAQIRFAAPRAPQPWGEPQVCCDFGPMAVQPAGRDKSGAEEIEDCLRLDVRSPALRGAEPRPVLVYLHGGAYNDGTVNDDLCEGARLAGPEYEDGLCTLDSRTVRAG